ncbi:MAG: hypothetical protein KZQ82_18970 [Candidatus Thiodiazotropha sp. (ex Lucinoma annulata)]|nr:hypothetical protein [Candidatus Thiodiazotropha sp. (ex Lucinoma borealis)]MCU7841003.1 hypothetical protein [Candidatus Thiodiazotropha sp. (ex Troendleina suluensis)]MCU7886277.1 hypothetical protein [Candidatus Thiodiazotropha sp. (ex Lucinoma annulata)]MCU7945381.1 hypothetical protein [Candidatus Thiodiazotropha sp. (ex Cardiolucina cf. quadrata)]MCU7866564.1 hypothetical protein [Candidatus Thiodiazotropha sp. (ex Lucinoma borealis)]
MAEAKLELQTLAGYALLLLGFIMLLVNHASIIMGDPWLIPTFLRLY